MSWNMIVLLKLLVIFGVCFLIEAKTNLAVKNVKRFGEIKMANNFKTPILASVTRVNSKLEPVSLPFLAKINPNLNSRIQPAFTFLESGPNTMNDPVGNKYPKAEEDKDFDYFSSNVKDPKNVSESDKDSDEDPDEDSDYFGANDKDPKNAVENDQEPENESENVSNINTDYFQSNDKDPKNEPGNDRKEYPKTPIDEIDNYVDDDNDAFYDDHINSTVLRRNIHTNSNAAVDELENEKKFKCDHIICPKKTFSCKSTVEAVEDDFIQVEIITECLSSTNEVLATKKSRSDNPSSGKYLFVIQTMDNEGNIELSFNNRTENDLIPRKSVETPKYTKLFVNDFLESVSKSKRRKAKDKLRRIKAMFNMRKENDDEEEPPTVITNPDADDFDNFIIKKKFNAIEMVEGNSTYHNVTSRNNQRSNVEESYKEPDIEEEELNLVESDELICVGVECPKEAFKCKTFDDSVPPDFTKIQIIVQCLTKDDVVVHTETLERINFQKGVYMHSESLLNRYGELNTMAEHFPLD